MISSLKRNTLSNYPLILVIISITWLLKVFFLRDYFGTNFAQPLLPFEGYLNEAYPILSILLGIILFFIVGFFLNYLNLRTVIIDNAYQMPGFFFAVLSGFFIALQEYSPELLANALFMLSIYRLFATYRKHKAFSNFFDSGFLLACASLFHLNIVAFIFINLILIISLRLINIKEIAAFFIGFITPLILCYSYFYLFSEISIFHDYINSEFFKYNHNKYSSFELIISIPMFILVIIGFLSFFLIKNFRKVVTRKYINIFLIMTVCFSIYYLSPYSGKESAVFLFVPISYLLSNILVNLKDKYGNILIYGIFTMLIISQAYQFVYISAVH